MYKTIILSCFVCVCVCAKVGSLTKERTYLHIMRVFKNRVLKIIFGPKSEKVAEG
jgi:hypothetical protein